MFECNHYCGTRALVNFPRTAVALVLLLLNFLLTAMLNCAKQTSFLCVGRRASSSIEARKGGKISSSEILDCSKVQILSSQTHSSISAPKGTFLKKKSQIMWLLFQAIHVFPTLEQSKAHCFLHKNSNWDWYGERGSSIC